MAIDKRQLATLGVYETASGQPRKVMRLTLTRAYYQILSPEHPRYETSVSKGKFAADAVRRRYCPVVGFHAVARALASSISATVILEATRSSMPLTMKRLASMTS